MLASWSALDWVLWIGCFAAYLLCFAFVFREMSKANAEGYSIRDLFSAFIPSATLGFLPALVWASYVYIPFEHPLKAVPIPVHFFGALTFASLLVLFLLRQSTKNPKPFQIAGWSLALSGVALASAVSGTKLYHRVVALQSGEREQVQLIDAGHEKRSIFALRLSTASGLRVKEANFFFVPSSSKKQRDGIFEIAYSPDKKHAYSVHLVFLLNHIGLVGACGGATLLFLTRLFNLKTESHWKKFERFKMAAMVGAYIFISGVVCGMLGSVVALFPEANL